MSDNTKAIRMTPEVVEAINELLAESNVDLTIVSLTNAEEALKMTAYDDDKLWEFFRFALIRTRDCATTKYWPSCWHHTSGIPTTSGSRPRIYATTSGTHTS